MIDQGIGNELNNETRYLIIGPAASKPIHALNPMKKSIAIAAPNEPGALFKIVAAFALRNMPVLKIESRPAATAQTSGARHWDYVFYVDYEPSASEKTNTRLLENLEEHSLWIRELGKYSQNLSHTSVEQPRWHDICDIISYS